MKKSKIIVPALALLAFTSISSVSGTVAWFTASRGGSFSTSNFKVVNPEGNMAIALTKLIGTEISKDVVNVTTSNVANSQVDASFDHTSQTLWQDVPSDDGTQPVKFTKGTLTEAGAKIEDHVYTIIAWYATFTYTFGADTDDVNLYFNAEESDFTVGGDGIMADADNDEHLYTYRGFRLAMVDSTKTQKRVWAPEQEYDECAYINAEDGTLGSYVPAVTGDATPAINEKGDLITSDRTLDKIDAGSTGSKKRADYLGSFVKPAAGNSTTVGVTFYAWFEGTDCNIINDVRMDSVSLALKFYCRTNKAA